MDDTAGWFVRLGLSDYAEAFTEDDVGDDVFPQLKWACYAPRGVSCTMLNLANPGLKPTTFQSAPMRRRTRY